MKYICLLFIALPAFAGQYEKCQKDVERIRNTPAKLITIPEWDKMMDGCTKYLPKFEDTMPITEPLPAEVKVSPASAEELNREFDSYQALTAKLAAQTEAHLQVMHEESMATQRAAYGSSL